jgi:hypothetical protein
MRPPVSWLAPFITAVSACAVGVSNVALGHEAPRRYEIVTETDMPHLEENLRYATRYERGCLDRHDLSRAFWMLGHVSLQDCKLVKASEDAGSAMYRLQCDGGHGTTGDARWQFESDHLTGTLRVRLGGKNMTFYQRITATAASDSATCGSDRVGSGRK